MAASQQQTILVEALNDLNAIVATMESETPQALIGKLFNNVKTVYQYQAPLQRQQEVVNREVERIVPQDRAAHVCSNQTRRRH